MRQQRLAAYPATAVRVNGGSAAVPAVALLGCAECIAAVSRHGAGAPVTPVGAVHADASLPPYTPANNNLRHSLSRSAAISCLWRSKRYATLSATAAASYRGYLSYPRYSI